MTPVPVHVAGFGWSSILLAVSNLLIGGVLVALIKSRPTLKKIANDREANLLSERAVEMDKMRATIAKLDRRMIAQAKRHDAQNEILRQLHEGEIALLRHRVNGEEQINIALMTVLQTLDVPARTMAALEETRARKQEAIASEQSALTLLRAAALERLALLSETDE